MMTLTPHKLPKRFRNHSNFFRTYSPKLGRIVDSYSALEHRFMVSNLESDHNVSIYCEQTPYIDEQIHGIHLRYVPDFYVRYSGGLQGIFEVKPTEKLILNELGELVPDKRWDLIQLWCQSLGWFCEYITEEELALYETHYANWKQILAALSVDVDEIYDSDVELKVFDFASREVKTTISDVISFFTKEDPDLILIAIYRLLHSGRLSTDLKTTPLTYSSILIPAVIA